jgi:hypothetical protein
LKDKEEKKRDEANFWSLFSEIFPSNNWNNRKRAAFDSFIARSHAKLMLLIMQMSPESQ